MKMLTPIRPVTASVTCFRDTCNVYVLRSGSEAIAIDWGSGAVLDRLEELGVERITDILVTHHHRDQVQGLARAAAAGVRIWVPPVERALIEHADRYWRTRKLQNDYDLRQDRSGREGRIGIALSLSPHYPVSDSEADREVSWASDGYVNRWFLDSLFRGSYPADMRRRYEDLVGPLDFVQERDLEVIAVPNDYLGINYYAPRVMRAVPGRTPYPWEVVVPDDVPTTDGGTDGVPRTEAGTPIMPGGLTDLLLRVRDDYGDLPVLITENGAVFCDPVHDERRILFIQDHLVAVHDAIEQGVPVIGYCHWSLLDNFEWALGYAQRFGLIHVDYATQERTVKDSGRYYAQVARANALVSSVGEA